MKIKVVVLKKILVPGIAEIEIDDKCLKRIKGSSGTYVAKRARRTFEDGKLPIKWHMEEAVEGEYRFTCFEPIKEVEMRDQEFDVKNIWGERCDEYNNSHIRVELIKEKITDEDVAKFEDLIMQDHEFKPLFGSLENAFYAERSHREGGYDTIVFDIHKGDFEAAKRLSFQFPDAVVFVNDDWDYHIFEVYREGEKYNDYEVSFDGDDPADYTYEEDLATRYDIDVKINIHIPFGSGVHSTQSGSTFCVKENYDFYKKEIDTHPVKQEKDHEI